MKKTMIAVVALLIQGACAHSGAGAMNSGSSPQQTAQGGGTPAPTLASSTMAMPEGATCTADEQCQDRQLCIRSQCTNITPSLAECDVIRVHFDFDKAEVHENDRVALSRAARCINGEQNVHFLIVGNADERGTEEYNLALGDRRATAVAHYLGYLGVDKNRLNEVSYGKDRPLCTEHDEKCWAVNRRAAIRQANAPKPQGTATNR